MNPNREVVARLLRDGKTARSVEYWLDCEPAVPDWRADLRQRFEPEL